MTGVVHPLVPPTAAPSVGSPLAALSLDAYPSAAYFTNHALQIEWANEPALSELFGLTEGLPERIDDRNALCLLVDGGKFADLESTLSFHVAMVRERLGQAYVEATKSELASRGVKDGDRVFAKTAAPRTDAGVSIEFYQATRNDLAGLGQIVAIRFDQGVLFLHQFRENSADFVNGLLAQQNHFLREVLRHRRPYLTNVAILAADLQDSVKICAELPPEEYFEMINEIWSGAETINETYAATHGKHAGDGLLYYFFPQPDSSYVMNALKYACELRDLIGRISKNWQRKKNWLNDLVLNVGVHEGEEWFGVIHRGHQMECSVLGDTVNHCARLSDFARGGSIWATKSMVGKLTSAERALLRYGVRRTTMEGQQMLVPSTFARISNLLQADNPRHHKLMDIASLTVTEILDLGIK
jgi:class 3 adenylate cyclase